MALPLSDRAVPSSASAPAPASATPAPKRPPAVLRIDPAHWDPDYTRRKAAPELVGMRRLSQAAKNEIEVLAYEYAESSYPKDRTRQIEAFNERLICLALARAFCSPNDASKRFFEIPDEEGPRAFTSEFLRVAWSQYEAMVIRTSPSEHEVTDDELPKLCALLSSGRIGTLSSTIRQRQIRRLLGYVLVELEGAAGSTG